MSKKKGGGAGPHASEALASDHKPSRPISLHAPSLKDTMVHGELKTERCGHPQVKSSDFLLRKYVSFQPPLRRKKLARVICVRCEAACAIKHAGR
jgi:hypothetical protein